MLHHNFSVSVSFIGTYNSTKVLYVNNNSVSAADDPEGRERKMLTKTAIGVVNGQ